MIRKYHQYADPQHSWVKVRVSELVDLGIRDAISPYSYYRVDSKGVAWSYLEEDLDFDIFFKAKQARSQPVQVANHHTNNSSSIRSYQNFPSAPNWREVYHTLDFDAIKAPGVTKNGVRYFGTYEEAKATEKRLLPEYPGAHIVSYTSGYAVQYYISGPYFPQREKVAPENEQVAAVVENADFSVDNQGSISILWAKTEAAEAWVAEHIPEDAQTWGRNGTVIEHRYVRDIVEGIINDGLTVS